MLCRVKNSSGQFISRATRTRHIKQEREFSQWSNTQSTAASATNQDIFGTATERDNVESESMSAISMMADQELFDSESEEEGEEEEADEIYEEEEDMIEAEDLGKYSYDLTQMCTPNGYIFYIRIGNLRRSD
jgi:hypothetical protein